MAVIHANVIKRYLDELDRYYTELRKIAEGTPLSEDREKSYRYIPDDPEPLVEVDIYGLEDGIAHFKVSVDALKRLKSHTRKIR